MIHRQLPLCLLFVLWSLSSVCQVSDLNIDIPDGATPWSSLKINRSENQFQFAIVTDRTGGRRPGVFMRGVEKLNLLQPEFVMTVGDLIDGYTRDVVELDRQWNEFTGFIDSLQMPFFYTPGNHDITNAVMDSVYRERFGPTYYHFVYKNVLFLCLNSEDQFRGAGRGTISDEQYEYIKKTLEENKGVRWTMLFMHQPLWLQDDPVRWPDVETLLAGREHTVFVGHVHRYVRYERNNARYYTLATTGGGSRLRGPALGEFDHITWVTMTDEGPLMANLALDGIYADDLVTETGYEFISRLTSSAPVRFEPILLDDEIFESGVVRTEIRNPEDQPVFVHLKPSFNFDYSFDLPRDTITVGPNSVEVIEWELRSRRGPKNAAELPSQLLNMDLTYTQNGSRMSFPLTYRVAPERRRLIPAAENIPVIDGQLADWMELPYTFGAEDPDDLKIEWGVQRDADHLYFAARVADDTVRIEEKIRENFGLIINGEPLATSIMRKSERGYRDSYSLRLSPENSGIRMELQDQDRYEFKVDIKTRTTPEGYTVELAFPLAYIKELQGDEWRHLRINVAAMDMDADSDQGKFYFWRPEWGTSNNYVGSGLFFRE